MSSKAWRETNSGVLRTGSDRFGEVEAELRMSQGIDLDRSSGSQKCESGLELREDRFQGGLEHDRSV